MLIKNGQIYEWIVSSLMNWALGADLFRQHTSLRESSGNIIKFSESAILEVTRGVNCANVEQDTGLV